MKKIIALACFLLCVPFASFALDNGENIANLTEPSGAVWHQQQNSLFVVGDEGDLYQLNAAGDIINTWHPGGDLEGITVADENSSYLYLGIEHPDAIKEFDISTGSLTGKTWDLTNWMAGDSSSGLEALTYVDGVFYAGLQADGDIYKFVLDLNQSETLSYQGKINTSLTDLSGSDFVDNILYLVYDGPNILETRQADGTLISSESLPGEAQEGIAVDNLTTYITEDTGAVMKYTETTEVDDVVIIDTGSSGISPMQDVLETTYNVSIISINELMQGVPSGTEVVIFPGGASFISEDYISYTVFPFSVYLHPDIKSSLQTFVNNGGGFVGICGGSVVGSALLETEIEVQEVYPEFPFNLTITEVGMADVMDVHSVEYLEWYENYATQDNNLGQLSFNDHVVLEDYAQGMNYVDYYGGPVFKNYQNVEVLATYTQQIEPAYYNTVGEPAIVLKDNVILSAVHPEYDSDTHFLLENYVAWVNGTFEEPDPDPEPVDNDGDGYNEDEDCNDNDPDIFEDQTYYLDNDGDGLGDASNTTSLCSLTPPSGYVDNANDLNDNDFDNDGSETGVDCDDTDAGISKNQTYFADNDGDGLGDLNNSTSICSYETPEGYVDNADDVNDNDHDNDGAEADEDCDDHDIGIIYEQTYYYDADGDGLGDAGNTTSVCSYTPPAGYVENADDVNDNDFDNDGSETGIDCDDNDPAIYENQRYYVDNDGDGLGDPENYVDVCSLTIPEGYVDNADDDNDNPEPEPIDNDGDGYPEEEDCNDNDPSIHENQTYYYDADGDGLGNPEVAHEFCTLTPPENYVANADDLNDLDYDNDGVFTEDDCNDNDPAIYENQRYYRDQDGDGLGDPENYTDVCSLTPPAGYVDNTDDDDDNPAEGLDVELDGQFVYINGQQYHIFKSNPFLAYYRIHDYYNDGQDEVLVVGFFWGRIEAYILEYDAYGNINVIYEREIRFW